MSSNISKLQFTLPLSVLLPLACCPLSDSSLHDCDVVTTTFRPPPSPLGLQQVLYINFGTPSLFLPFTIRPPSRSHPPRMTPLQLRVPPFLSLSLYSSQGPASSSEPLPPLPVSSHPCQGPASPTGPLASVPGTCICLRDPHFTPSPPLSEAAHPRRGLHPLGKPPALPRSPHPRAGGRTSSAGCVLSTSTRHAGWQCSRRKW